MTDRWEADDEEMRVRSILADYVNGHLSRGEREYGLSGFGDEDRFQLTTYVPTWVKSVLRHRFAKIEWVYIYKEDDRNERVENLAGLVDENPVPDVEGVQATLPIGALTIKGSVRSSARLSKVINTPEEAEEARQAFDTVEEVGD